MTPWAPVGAKNSKNERYNPNIFKYAPYSASSNEALQLLRILIELLHEVQLLSISEIFPSLFTLKEVKLTGTFRWYIVVQSSEMFTRVKKYLISAAQTLEL